MTPHRLTAERVVDEPREAALEDRATRFGSGLLEAARVITDQAVNDPGRRVDEAGEFVIGRPEPVDMKRSTHWAIAPDLSAGFKGVGAALFELVNRETGRAHTLNLINFGLGISGFDLLKKVDFIDFSGGPPSYTMFRTDRPVNFADFEGRGARVTQASAIAGEIVYLTLWEDKAYFSPRFLYVRMGGWGFSTPAASFGHGVTTISYGSGERSGLVPLVLELEPRDIPLRPRLVQIRNSAMESPRVDVPNDILFEFDSAELGPDAIEPLEYLADLLNNRLREPVDIEGHSDSVGPPEYNMDLSRRRAETVREWFVDAGVYKAEEFAVRPYGETQPIAPNTNPDGSDNPEGRRQNRRVTIRAVWNF